MRARFKRVKDFFVWQLHAGGITLGVVQIKPEIGADDQIFASVIGKHTNPQFWPLKVGQNTDRAVEVRFDLPDDRVARPDFCVVTMAHVQAEHIGARFVQSADHLVIIGCRTKRRDDLYIAVASHEYSLQVGQIA